TRDRDGASTAAGGRRSRAIDGRTLRERSKGRLFRFRQGGYSSRHAFGIGGDGRLSQVLSTSQSDDRGPLRRTRLDRIQSGAGRPAGASNQGLFGLAGSSFRPHADGELREGTAVL